MQQDHAYATNIQAVNLKKNKNKNNIQAVNKNRAR